MADLTAVDPGDRWVGVALFDVDDTTLHGWRCTDAFEMGPDEFMDALTGSVLDNETPLLVFERWRLYNDLAEEQTGSEFETCQLIGQMKYLVRKHNEHCGMHTEATNKGKMLSCELQGRACMDPAIRWQPVHMVGQMADIKKPTTGILRQMKIKSVAKPISKAKYSGRDHIMDAELHGWHHILHGSLTGKMSRVYYGE